MAEKLFLLAEDDEDDKLIFTDIINGMEHHVTLNFRAVGNGVEVMQLLEEGGPLPDLVLLDQNMPQMNGKETLDKIKKDSRYQHIPVVIYSTYCDDRLSNECMQLGALEIFTKPDSFNGFEDMIKGLMERYMR